MFILDAVNLLRNLLFLGYCDVARNSRCTENVKQTETPVSNRV